MPERVRATVAAVVVTYNRKHLLAGLLEALLGQTRPPDAIFVVDNASTDGTERLMEDRYRGQVAYVRLTENGGGSAGFREGMKRACEAGYDRIWVMDDDVVPAPDCLERLLEQEPEAILAPMRRAPSGEVVERAALRFDMSSLFRWDPREQTVAQFVKTRGCGELPELLPVLDCSFEGPLIPGSLVRKIGLPREDFFLYADDAEYAWRARARAGVPVFCVTRARLVRQLEGAPAPAFPEPWRFYFYWRNMFWLFRTYGQTRRARLRPLPVWLARVMYSAVRFRFGEARVLTEALADSRREPLPRRYTPGGRETRFQAK